MSNSNSQHIAPDEDTLPEYDFTRGIRGKHYQDYRQGHTVKIHQEDGSIEVRHFTLDELAQLAHLQPSPNISQRQSQA
jgi:hypothetical protein